MTNKAGMSEEELELLIRLHQQGLSNSQIAKRVGCAVTTVEYKLKNRDLTPNKIRQEVITDADEAKVIELYRNNSVKSIAETMNCSPTAVRNCLLRHGIVGYNKDNANRKVNRSELSNIVELYKAGKTTSELGKLYGVSSVTISNYLKAEGVQTRKGPRGKNVNHNTFRTIDNEAKAYWLGFLMADGFVHTNNMVGLALAEKDLNHLRKYKKFMGSEHKIVSWEAAYDDTCEPTTAHRLMFRSKVMTKDLKHHGIGKRKTGNESIPRTVPQSLMRHFIRGLWDGDGTIFRDECGKVRYSLVGNYELLTELAHILYKEANTRLANVIKHKTIHSISYGSASDVAKLTAYFYDDATVYLERKREKAEPLSTRNA